MSKVIEAEKLRRKMGAGMKFYCRELNEFLFIVRTGRTDKHGCELYHVLDKEGKFFISDVPVYCSITEVVRYAKAKARRIINNNGYTTRP